MTWRLTFALAAFVTVLVADTMTKLVAPMDDWTWHAATVADPAPSVPWTLAAVSGALAVVAFQSIGMAVCLAGFVGNSAWAGVAGGNPNPLVEPAGEGWRIAYNVADLALQAGAFVAAVEVGVVAMGWATRARGRAILRAPD